MVNVIAFKGKAKTGKTTAGAYLVNRFGYQRMRFADKLKNMLRALGLTGREVDGDLKESPCDILGGQTPRHAMITLGTEWGRDMIHPNIWVNAIERDMIVMRAEGINKFVIDDLRFLNEANYINSLRERDNYRVMIVELVGRKGTGSTHISETEMDNIKSDVTISNVGTMQLFHESLEVLMDIYFKEE